ncbi:YfhO family protein [Alsobacter sp. SYSU M60028]|uniref:YfhO family protein n=1 Tax=Alsobacter ponti TaxID=2962936 RepID=A0ABT1LBQ2_9HYPH|nr:YfhO family protein [Alsobacter ponti]MCP8938391.1 YfhO family protein [Alsobacter ponti]
MPPTNRAFRLAPALLLVCGAWLVLAWPWLSGRVTIPWDAKAHFQAQFQFLADSIHRGEWPFWNPFVFAGSPQIADPQSLVFSPPYLLAALVTPNPGFQLADGIALGMLLAGGIGIVLIFRDRGWHWIGAVVAAIAFAFGASAAWRVQHTGQVLSLGWFPLALFCLMRALERSSAGWGFASGFVAGFLVLGRDQVALLAVYVLAGWVAWWWLAGEGRARRLRASLVPLACGVLGGLLVAAVPMAMTLLLAGETSRAAIIDLPGAERGSLHPASLLTAFVANLYGTDGPLAEFWGQPSPAWGPTDLYLARNMSDVYLGAIPLVALIVLGAARGALAAREARFFVVAFVALTLYALGRYTPAFAPAFHSLPGASLFRRPADATFLMGALAAVLAGYCIHRLLAGDLRSGLARTLGGGVALAAGLAACVAVAVWKGRLAQAAPFIAIGAVSIALSALALFVAARLAPRHAGLAGLLLAATLTADLALSNGPNESTALPPVLYDVLRPDSANATIALLRARLPNEPDRRDRVELAGVDFHWPNASMVHRLDNTLGYNPVHLNDYSRATGAQDHVALPDQRVFAPLMPSYRSRLADLLGLRLIATRGDIADIDRSLAPGDIAEIGRTADGRVYENPRALPRVLFPSGAIAADFEALIRTGAWPDFDPRATVLLERPQGGSAGTGPAGTVAIRRYANTEVIVDAESANGGYVVLNDAWHPWWRAEIDGRPAPLLKANVLFRAVAVPPGRHEVRFVFRPFVGMAAELAERLAGR